MAGELRAALDHTPFHVPSSAPPFSVPSSDFAPLSQSPTGFVVQVTSRLAHNP